jgi:hypothetical protein
MTFLKIYLCFETETSLADMHVLHLDFPEESTFVPGFVGVLLRVLNQHFEESPMVRKSDLRYFLCTGDQHYIP